MNAIIDSLPDTKPAQANANAVFLNSLAHDVFEATARKGFWDKAKEIENLENCYSGALPDVAADDDLCAAVEDVLIKYSARNIPEMIALMHSELSEALEAHRKGKRDDHLPHRTGLEVELADCVIRILDAAGGLGLDIGGAVVEKLAFNETRPHKHGKKY